MITSADVRMDPRVREQEWGNIGSTEDLKAITEERERIGRFFFRFPNGESGAGVIVLLISDAIYWSIVIS